MDDPRSRSGRRARAVDRMIEYDLRGRGIRDELVLEAMRRVPRHLFVDPADADRAYEDCALPIGHGQTISQPFVVASTIEALRIRPGHRVLEVGAGSGYAAAAMAELGAEVHAVERLALLAERARANLAEAGYDRVQVHVGDGSVGLAEYAPYDGIAVSAGAPDVPRRLVGQLVDGGRLVIPVGEMRHQDLLLVIRRGDDVERRVLFGCAFVPLVGEEGWRR
jgi:protein-L-isoaspartate(D-aspartate) O-methyltransferase